MSNKNALITLKIMEKNKKTSLNLAEIQAKIHAPKNQRNNFGNYNYRSCEDILEAAKKVLSKYDAYIIISDEIMPVNDRIYIKATATISNGTDSISVTAYAREEETKKGMDAAQITGSASSYARKYALNGLLAIDDTKDSDATNTHGNEKQSAKKPAPKPKAKSNGTTTALQAKLLPLLTEARKYEVITTAEYDKVVNQIQTMSADKLECAIDWVNKKLYQPKQNA